MTEFAIPLTHWTEFAAQMSKLNRKAAKLGCEPIKITVVEQRKVERRHHFKVDGQERSRVYMVDAKIIDIEGKAPQIAGYQFVAKVEYLSDGASVLFHTVPGCDVKIDERIRALRPATCEHCAKIRRRAETFVVRNVDTGEQKQVGRNCLADFTGINTPEKIAGMTKWLYSFSNLDAEIDGYWGGPGGFFESTVDTVTALTLTSAAISLFGWTPRSAADMARRATADMVGVCFASQKSPSEVEFTAKLWREVEAKPGHAEQANAVVAWIKSDLRARAKSDYEMNLVTLVVNDLTERKHLGIVCSAVSAYLRAMNQKIEYAKNHEKLQHSAHVGSVKTRLRNIQATIDSMRMLEAGDWGPRTMIKFLDDSGNVMTWFASGNYPGLEPGRKVKITGTVKAHNEYQGVKETQLTRVDVCRID
jgi:hypothetical protein